MSVRTPMIVAAGLFAALVIRLPAQQPPAPAPRAGAPVSAAARSANQRGPAVPAVPAVPAGPASRPQAARDTTDSTAAAIDYRREVYNYQGASRDPFATLMNESSTQTSVNDLRLVGVVYDARGGRSVAVVREKNNPRPYRLRRGDSIGRLHVIQIRKYEVVFQVEEFGFERQEVLALSRPEVNR